MHDMRKPDYRTPKRPGGISLIPELWNAIDAAARLAGVPRNRIMENVLMERFGLSCDSQKTAKNSYDVGTVQAEEIDGD